MSELMIVDQTGDTRLQWNKKNAEEIAAAKLRFDELKTKGYLAYKVDKSGGQGEVLHEFDANAERIILNPRMIGG